MDLQSDVLIKFMHDTTWAPFTLTFTLADMMDNPRKDKLSMPTGCGQFAPCVHFFYNVCGTVITASCPIPGWVLIQLFHLLMAMCRRVDLFAWLYRSLYFSERVELCGADVSKPFYTENTWPWLIRSLWGILLLIACLYSSWSDFTVNGCPHPPFALCAQMFLSEMQVSCSASHSSRKQQLLISH